MLQSVPATVQFLLYFPKTAQKAKPLKSKLSSYFERVRLAAGKDRHVFPPAYSADSDDKL
jgi:hypothetical protein